MARSAHEVGWTDIIGLGWDSLEHFGLISLVLLMLAGYAWLMSAEQKQRGRSPGQAKRTRWFLAALAALYLAESPPLHILSEVYLLSAHMIQHLLLIVVLPVGILRGLPPEFWVRITRPRPVFAAVRLLTHPIVAFLLFNFTYNVWHVPGYYQLALVYHSLHIVEHITFTGAAFLMWWPLLSPHPGLPRLQAPQRLAYLFLLSVAQLAVTGPLVFLDHAAYQHYAEASRFLGVSAMTDQQMAGILMKIPSTILFGSMFCRTFLVWAAQEEKREPQGDEQQSAS